MLSLLVNFLLTRETLFQNRWDFYQLIVFTLITRYIFRDQTIERRKNFNHFYFYRTSGPLIKWTLGRVPKLTS